VHVSGWTFVMIFLNWMQMKPKTLILRAAGTNGDKELAHAFELAGASTEFVHVNQLLESPNLLDDFQLLAFPGGFSYGDDIASGRILANQLHHHMAEPLRRFVGAGKPVIGVCNGFQILVKTSLLPGAIGGRTGQTCTLAHNTTGRFIDQWVTLGVQPSKCIWTSSRQGAVGSEQGAVGRGQDAVGSGQGGGKSASSYVLELPIAHGEGRFVPADDNVRKALWDNGQVALVYTRPDGSAASGESPHNPNGSVDDIAGVCDATGLVFGLMPHPERYTHPTHHPAWTRQKPLPDEGRGLQIFRNAVRYVGGK